VPPVACDLLLSGAEADAASANVVVQLVFDRVLLVIAGAYFGPEIGDAVIAAELERDEVVDLVTTGCVRADAVGGVDVLFG
jgi:hypothetical protein